MFNFKKCFAGLVGLSLIVVSLIALFLPASTHGQDNIGNGPPANNPNPSELLSIGDADGSQCPGGFQGAREINDVFKRDGTIGFNGNAVPAGQVFVITDIPFIDQSPPAESIRVRLGVPCGSGCMVPLVDAVVVTGSNGQGETKVSLAQGF